MKMYPVQTPVVCDYPFNFIVNRRHYFTILYAKHTHTVGIQLFTESHNRLCCLCTQMELHVESFCFQSDSVLME